MESITPASVKIEPPAVYIDYPGQEIYPPSESYPSISMQDHPELEINKLFVSKEPLELDTRAFTKLAYDSTDMKVVKQELLDVRDSIIQEMTEHNNSESIIVESNCKASVKQENWCNVSENVSSVIDTNNKLSLAIENCQQQNKETQEKYIQSCAKSVDDIFYHVDYSCHRTDTGDVSDVSSPNVCAYEYKRTHSEGMLNKCDERDGLLIQDDHSECRKSMNHKKIHKGEKTYKCDDCGFSFNRAGNLKRHKRIHTGEKPYKCDMCDASFSQVGHVKGHKRSHTGEKPYMCDVCGASFSKVGHLKGHKRSHTGEKPYVCDACGASFTVVGSLKDHKRTHTGEKPFKCDVCDASFTQTCSLKRHERTHTGEKPYKCDVCDASFSQSHVLKRHKRTHTREKPYKCDVCGASFTQAGSLKRHKMTHTGEKS